MEELRRRRGRKEEGKRREGRNRMEDDWVMRRADTKKAADWVERV